PILVLCAEPTDELEPESCRIPSISGVRLLKMDSTCCTVCSVCSTSWTRLASWSLTCCGSRMVTDWSRTSCSTSSTAEHCASTTCRFSVIFWYFSRRLLRISRRFLLMSCTRGGSVWMCCCSAAISFLIWSGSVVLTYWRCWKAALSRRAYPCNRPSRRESIC